MTSAELLLSLRADARQVSLAAATLRTYCDFAGLPGPTLGQIELAVVEALNNVIEHACQDRSDAEIHMAVRVENDSLIVELRDPGRSLAVLPNPEMPDPLDESGRGWPLIFLLMDRVDYYHERGVNILTLGKRLPEDLHR